MALTVHHPDGRDGHDIIDANGMPNLDTPDSLKAVQLIRKWVDEGIIGTIPTGNAIPLKARPRLPLVMSLPLVIHCGI